MTVGCSSHDDSDHSHGEHEHGDTSDHTTCTGHEATYAPGVTADSANGKFKVTLDEAVDLQVGDVTLNVTVVDAAGAPIEDAAFTTNTTTWQHVHGHTGTSTGGTVTGGTAGKYTITKMTVLHAGSWEFWIDLTIDGETDRAKFHFCVPEVAE